VVVRVDRGEKGGRDPTATLGPKSAGHRFQGREFVAESSGDLIDWLGVNEDRAKGLILTLEGLFGLEEEAAGVTLVHHAGSRKLIIFWPGTGAERTAKIGVETGSSRPSPHIGALKTGPNAWNALGHARNRECRFDPDRVVPGRINDQRFRRRSGQFSEESRLPNPKKLIIFPAAEIGVQRVAPKIKDAGVLSETSMIAGREK
jgi:hypothetical protein